jgi:hypothetical protein
LRHASGGVAQRRAYVIRDKEQSELRGKAKGRRLAIARKGHANKGGDTAFETHQRHQRPPAKRAFSE